MKIRMVPALGIAALLVLGCSKVPKDNSPVLVSVGADKITQNQFTAMVKVLAGNDAQAQEVLNGEGMRAQRNHFLESLAQDKAVTQLAKSTGLDKDLKVKLQVDQVVARVYMQALIEKRAGEPTDAELKAMLEKLMKSQAQPGKDVQMPPFESVKPQLVNLWKQEKTQTLVDALLKEAQQKSPVTYAEGYKPLPVPQQPAVAPAEAAPAQPKPKK